MIIAEILKSTRLIPILFIFAFTISVHGQIANTVEPEPILKNSVYLEAFGHGFLYSVNYERTIWGNTFTQTSGNIGVAYYGKGGGVVPLWVPISILQSFHLGKDIFIEAGVGKMLRNDGVVHLDGSFQDDYEMEDWIFRLGAKKHFNDKWLLKIAYTPIYLDSFELIHWGGLAFGYRF